MAILHKKVAPTFWLVSLLLVLGYCYDARDATGEGNKEKTDSCINKCAATCQEQCTYNNYACDLDCLIKEVE